MRRYAAQRVRAMAALWRRAVDDDDEDATISINYTSGTTGQPKGVMYTHRGATLSYLAAENRIYCRKHKARFGGDGSWLSGRRTRALDRFPIRVVNGQVVVTTDTLLEQDIDGAAYDAAEVMLP